MSLFLAGVLPGLDFKIPRLDVVPHLGAKGPALAAAVMPGYQQKACLIRRQIARLPQSRSKYTSHKQQLPAGPGSFLLSEPRVCK
jgi:hypothetical protein